MYGDGVKDVAFTVFDAEKAWDRAIKNGARAPTSRAPIATSTAPSPWPASAPTAASSTPSSAAPAPTTSPRSSRAAPSPQVPQAHRPARALARCGPTRRSVLAINDYNKKNPCGLKYVDHLVGNVELGKMNHWVKFYENVLEFSMFKHFDDKDISTEYSALMSKVMASGNNLIKMPINEPAEGKKKSQVQEYLDWHCNTPGVQHLALRTDDELHSIAALRAAASTSSRSPTPTTPRSGTA
jgi:4-hydroxyphenylpyruvate dioxygenase-like putative hemolysin